MSQTSFSDISSGSIQQDQFDCERMLFSDAPQYEPTSINSTQKMASANIQTNCSNKSEIICYGSFIKGLQRYTQQLSYQDSVYDIYNPKELYYADHKLNMFKTSKELSKEYIVTFQKSKPKKKSVSKIKSPSIVSSPSMKKLDIPKLSMHSKPQEQYFTPRTTIISPRNNKHKQQRLQKPSISKKSKPKQSISKSKSKISLNKNKFIQKRSTKSTLPSK